jgi:hypothetical protein
VRRRAARARRRQRARLEHRGRRRRHRGGALQVRAALCGARVGERETYSATRRASWVISIGRGASRSWFGRPESAREIFLGAEPFRRVSCRLGRSDLRTRRAIPTGTRGRSRRPRARNPRDASLPRSTPSDDPRFRPVPSRLSSHR